jgi:hypothetical protein
MITMDDPPVVAGFERPLETETRSIPTDALLLARLRWVTFVMWLTYGIALIWVVSTRDDLHQPMVALLGLRVTLVMIVLGLLFGEFASSPRHVQLFKLALFGGLTVCLALSQYLIGRDGLRAGQLAGFVILAKDGLIELLILMIAYGLLVPDTPRRAAVSIMTMALAPYLALTALLMSEPAAARSLVELHAAEQVGLNALMVWIGAGLAWYAAQLHTKTSPTVP